jgi:C-terminal processing protease CtpA/Prc
VPGRIVLAFAFFLAVQTAGGAVDDFTGNAVRATVLEVAATVSREYMDPVVAERLANSLRRRLTEGEYLSVTAPDALAARLTRDLFAESQDKHLAVAVALESASTTAATPAANTREQGVRRTNAGVQRVEILAGNVGYLNLTAFWRVEEAREIIADAMRLLRRADALIIDLRQNSGGAPDTAALMAGYLFDQAGLPLFHIVPRSGNPVAYATPAPAPLERDGRRAVYVLTSSRTFSAGEGLAFLLQERARAEVIGERTAGAANPGRPYRVNAWFEVTVPNGQVRTAVSGGNWEGRGVKPDLEVAAADALQVAHTRAVKRLSEARLPPGELR